MKQSGLSLAIAAIVVMVMVPMVLAPVTSTQKAVYLKGRPGIGGQAILPDRPAHLIIQLEDNPTEEEKAALAARGIRLLEYIPEHAWIAMVDNPRQLLPNLHAASFLPSDKTSAPAGLVTIRLFGDVSREEGEDIVKGVQPDALYITETGSWLARLTGEQIRQLTEEDAVQRIEPARRPLATALDGLRTAAGVDPLHTAAYDLNGSGVVVAIWDAGWVQNNHPDMDGRVIIGDNASCQAEGSAYCSTQTHPTHVGGIIGGNGSLVKGVQRGVAWNATIMSYEWPDLGESEVLRETNDSATAYGAVISQNSWGYLTSSSTCGIDLGDYDSFTQSYDNITRGMHSSGNRTVLVVFSAGNERTKTNCNQSTKLTNTTTGPGGTAKNVITVGSVNSNDNSMTSYSSWGPTDDGRLKPEVVAPGDESGGNRINSTCPTSTYCTSGGTSMAAPAVSGVAALLVQDYRRTHGDASPAPSTVKALLLHTATDLNNTGPDFTTGYGLINATRAVDVIRQDGNGSVYIRQDSVTDGTNDTITILVPAGTAELRLTLVWDDYPASVSAAKTLVNDLDLVVTNSSGSRFYPWTLSPFTSPLAAAVQSTTDNTNIVEQVLVTSPQSGVWTIRMNGTSVPQGPQNYSLVSSSNLAGVVATANLPEDNIVINNSTMLFNCSGSVTDGTGLSSLSLFTNTSWGSINTSNVTGFSNNTVFRHTNFSDGAVVWGCRAVSNMSAIHFSANRTFTNQENPKWSANTTSVVTIYSPETLSFFNVTWTDNTRISTAILEANWSGENANYTMHNMSSVYQFNTSLPAGTVRWRSYANDSTGNLNGTDQQTFSVTRAVPDLLILLNGSSANLSINESQFVNITVQSTVAANNSILLNGSLVDNRTANYQNISRFTSPGVYNISLFFGSNLNYTANITTLFLTVNDTTLPVFRSVRVVPRYLLADENITVNVNATDNVNVTVVSFNISNSSFSSFQLLTAVNQTFFNISYNASALAPGTYTIILRANDSQGNTQNTSFAVTVSTPVILGFTIRDYLDAAQNVTHIRIIHEGRNETRNESSATASLSMSIASGFWDVEVAGGFNVTVRSLNASVNETFKITVEPNISNAQPLPSNTRAFINISAVSVNTTFANATIILVYNDSLFTNETRLNAFACHQWNSTNASCDSSWENVSANSSFDKNNNMVTVQTTNLSAFSVVETFSCGDGIVDANESCDGSALNGQSCASRGFTGGSLSCSASCAFVTSGCSSGSGGSGGGGSGGGATAKAELRLTSPADASGVKGRHIQIPLTVTNNGTTKVNVSFAASGCSSCIFRFPSLTLAAGQKETTNLTVNSTAAGSFAISIKATAGITGANASIRLDVTECASGEATCQQETRQECIAGKWSASGCPLGCDGSSCREPPLPPESPPAAQQPPVIAGRQFLPASSGQESGLEGMILLIVAAAALAAIALVVWLKR